MAHRVAYYLHAGVDPLARLVLHTCDNPPCCNPEHLFLGDDGLNATDRDGKNRSGSAKLTADLVREIRAEWHARPTHKSLAARYGVDPTVIARIVARKSWKHLL